MHKTTTKWSRKKLLKFSLITLILFFLFLELLGRIFFYVKFKGLHTSVYIQGSPLLVDDSFTVYNNRAFYVDYEKRFQYNELGMKTRPGDFKMPEKTPDDLWVLLLGASAMEGMGSNKNGKWFDITNVADHPHDETIAAFLESALQKNYPAKKVKVFNAGVSAYTLNQSMKRYKALSTHYDFDWVISMDGVNEPAELEEHENMQSYNIKQWAAKPADRYPLNLIIPITQHSAFLNLLKQKLFYIKQNARISGNKINNFPEREFWLKQSADTIQPIVTGKKVNKVLTIFLSELLAFEQTLKQDGKNYLLLVQPHLAFREENRFSTEEKALNNYYRTEHNDNAKFTFLKMAYDTVNAWSDENYHIQTMTGINKWQGWTFVDYCHFTSQANKRIAAELNTFIASGGNRRIFQD
jgi:hypothetical protein